jgi:hypothetical protein
MNDAKKSQELAFLDLDYRHKTEMGMREKLMAVVERHREKRGDPILKECRRDRKQDWNDGDEIAGFVE